MKFTLGFIAGLGAAWAALAIWQKIPVLDEFVWEADAEPEVDTDPKPLFAQGGSVNIPYPPHPIFHGDCTGFGGGIVTNIHGAP